MDEEKLALSCLEVLSPDLGYEDWRNVGMALHTVSEDLFDEWDQWSAKGEKYKPGECSRMWASFDSGGAIKLGTLISLAQSHGWKRPGVITPLRKNKTKKSNEDDKEPRAAQNYRELEELIGDDLRLNMLTQEIEVGGKPIENLDLFYLDVTCDFNIDIPKERCIDIVRKLALQNKYSPVVEHLKKIEESTKPLPKEEFNRCTERYFGVADELSQLMLKRTLIAAVARVFEPGCKVDTAFILHGKQGFFKSTFFSILGGEWFCDSLGDLRNLKDDLLVLHRHWIHEWGEIDRVTRKRDAEEIKAFITKAEDDVRPPYGRAPQRLARSSILVGSTNRDDFLKDSTGNRRYLIVTIDQPIKVDLLKEERDRLWAAAIEAYRAGETWYWSREEIDKVNERASEYLEQDPWLEYVAEYVKLGDEISISEIHSKCLKMAISDLRKHDEMRIADILRQLGCDKGKRRHDPQSKRKVQRWSCPGGE